MKPLKDFGQCFFGNVGGWRIVWFTFWCPGEEDSHTEREMV